MKFPLDLNNLLLYINHSSICLQKNCPFVTGCIESWGSI